MNAERLTHVPLHPPRSFEHSPGEHAYYDEWVVLMNQPRDPDTLEGDDDDRTGNLGLVLWQFPAVITDRHSRIAAGFARWLGTNVGSSIVREPARHGARRHTHHAEWCEQNKRARGVNGGWRSSDFLTSDDWSKPQICLDALDLEVLDLMAAWLDTPAGHGFIKRAEARLEAYRKGLRPQQFVITKDFQVIELAAVLA